ncbi:WYL domain-containing protein [Deinococcus sp. HMF7604]|uniref:helix-turn-helix transcriptional regulator n=1 Tax=Deinococcus betulae TaxID=2873312 RepID=UPI001CCF56CC|nr:WYL domain-containing protein [Deinococcus betulae]MBZ9751890.1 WYL domain-containing protein [Deinococcus betulae]
MDDPDTPATPPTPQRARREAKTWDKAKRLVRLQDLLKTRPYSTAELARKLEVGPRSIQRDMEVLGTMDVGLERDERGHYFIHLKADLPRPAETLAAYAALRLAHHHAPALANHYRHALDYLSRALPDHIRHTLNASVRDTGAAQFAERQMEQVALAWVDRRVLSFDYQRPNGLLERGNELCVYFIEISRTNLAPYVIGLERRHRNKIRTFKLSRMQNLQLLPGSYDPDPKFDPRDFLSDAWGVIGGAQTIKVLVRFAPEAAYRVIEGGFPNAREVRRDRFVDMEFSAGTDSKGFPLELMPFLLSWGPRAEVLGPPHVRAHWLQELRETLRRYDTPGPQEPEL